MQGWVSLHRKLLASEIFQNDKMLKIFIYCLLKASHTEHSQKVGRQTVLLKPGQFVYGRKKAAIELDMKESTVRDYMDILKEDGTIAMNPTNKFSIVTIVNWAFYQDKDEKTDNKNDSKKPTKGQQKDTNNNGNNADNDNNDINIYSHLFNHWNEKGIIKHRKMSQQMKKHTNARLEEYSKEELMTAIDNYKQVLESPVHYWTYKWTYEQFMKPSNVSRFVKDADPLNNYLDNSKQKRQPVAIGYDQDKDAF